MLYREFKGVKRGGKYQPIYPKFELVQDLLIIDLHVQFHLYAVRHC